MSDVPVILRNGAVTGEQSGFVIFTRYLLLQPMGSAAQSAKACPLRMTDDTVLAAAERTGFKNLSHYNRGFKARFGLTSREFRADHIRRDAGFASRRSRAGCQTVVLASPRDNLTNQAQCV